MWYLHIILSNATSCHFCHALSLSCHLNRISLIFTRLWIMANILFLFSPHPVHHILSFGQDVVTISCHLDLACVLKYELLTIATSRTHCQLLELWHD